MFTITSKLVAMQTCPILLYYGDMGYVLFLANVQMVPKQSK